MECATCKTTGTELKRCTGCYSIYYCSRSCQTQDWSKHRGQCKNTSYNTINGGEHKDKTDVVSRAANDSSRTGTTEVEARTLDTQKYSENSIEEEMNEEHTINLSGSHKKLLMEFDSEINSPRNEVESKVSYATYSSRDDYSNIRLKERPGDAKSGSEGNHSHDTDSVNFNCCENCGLGGCSKKCSRCKTSFYCSTLCQQADWKRHKLTCKKVYTDEELAILQTLREKAASYERHHHFMREKEAAGKNVFTLRNFEGDRNRFFQKLTEEQALVLAKRPDGSLQKAVKLAKSFYPREKVIIHFSDVPSEPVFPMFAGLLSRPSGYILVAFIYRYHEYVMRHGVYLKDAVNNDSLVHFYLDDRDDDPFPFFNYSQVKPGGYICLQNPLIHIFGDGSVGIRINDPSKVRVFDIEKVMAFSGPN